MATIPRVTTAVPHTARPLQIDQVEDLLKLQKAAQKINSILDLDQLIDKVVNDVARSFGCVDADVYLHDEARRELVLACAHGCAGCAVHGDHHSLKIGKDGMVGHVAGTRQMRYAPDVRKDPYYIGCEESTLSEVAIPLMVQGELVGVFSTSHPELDAFPPDHLRLLQALCAHVSVAVHNARRFQKERQQREEMSREAREAQIIQRALLPKNSPLIPGFALSGLSVPAREVGGDWYDFIPMSEGRWGMVLADVSGKGTAAALLMSATRGMLRSLAEARCSPGEVVTKLNQLLVDDFPAGRFVTLVYAVLEPASRTLTFANAGHLPPLLVDNQGARLLHSKAGLPLGIGTSSFPEVQVHLDAGSRLLFYSDGITEAENPQAEEFGTERLQSLMSEPEVSGERILESVHQFANSAGLHDDATVVLLET